MLENTVMANNKLCDKREWTRIGDCSVGAQNAEWMNEIHDVNDDDGLLQSVCVSRGRTRVVREKKKKYTHTLKIGGHSHCFSTRMGKYASRRM